MELCSEELTGLLRALSPIRPSRLRFSARRLTRIVGSSSLSLSDMMGGVTQGNKRAVENVVGRYNQSVLENVGSYQCTKWDKVDKAGLFLMGIIG